MNKPGGQQIEFDVFPKNPKGDYAYLADIKKDTRSDSSSFTVALPQQSVVILVLCVVLLLVASFTLGVERGKLISRNSVPAPAAPWDKISVPAPKSGESPKEKAALKQPEAAPTPAAAAKIEAPAAGSYVIQVASLKTEQAASQLAETLTEEGWPSFTKTSGNYVVVLAGRFSKKEEAQSRISELRKTYTDCFIKKI